MESQNSKHKTINYNMEYKTMAKISLTEVFKGKEFVCPITVVQYIASCKIWIDEYINKQHKGNVKYKTACSGYMLKLWNDNNNTYAISKSNKLGEAFSKKLGNKWHNTTSHVSWFKGIQHMPIYIKDKSVHIALDNLME